MPSTTRRTRVGYVALAVATIAVGLFVHRSGIILPSAVRDILGDALWAMMIVWWVGAVAPHARLWTRAAVSLGICFAVELSQLVHAPAIDAARGTTLGQLVLGSGFDPRDLLAYAAGVAAAILLDRTITAWPSAADAA